MSKEFTEMDGFGSQFMATSLGLVTLKGKQEGVELMSVEGISGK